MPVAVGAEVLPFPPLAAMSDERVDEQSPLFLGYRLGQLEAAFREGQKQLGEKLDTLMAGVSDLGSELREVKSEQKTMWRAIDERPTRDQVKVDYVPRAELEQQNHKSGLRLREWLAISAAWAAAAAVLITHYT